MTGSRGGVVGHGDESFGEPVAVLLVKLPSGRTLQCAVKCDPEGNGPGFLDIEESGQ